MNVCRRFSSQALQQLNKWRSMPGVKRVRKDVTKKAGYRVRVADGKLHGEPTPTMKQPQSMKDRQQAWVLAGLKHLRAPVVICWELISGTFSLMRGHFKTKLFEKTLLRYLVVFCCGHSPFESGTSKSIQGSGDVGEFAVCNSQPQLGAAIPAFRNICWHDGGDQT